MPTVAELRSEVERRVIDLPLHVKEAVPGLLKSAHRELQTRLNFAVMKETVERTTTAFSSSLGTLDHDLKEWREQPFWTDSLGHTRRFPLIPSIEEAARVFNQEPSLSFGSPQVLVAEPSPDGTINLSVFPFPDGAAITATGEYTIRIPLWAFRPFPETQDWFTLNAADWLTNRATAEAFLLNWDEPRAQVWLARAEREMNLLRQLEARRQTSHTGSILPKTGPNAVRIRF